MGEAMMQADAGNLEGGGGMPKFTTLKGVGAKLDIQNIDTDMIIPKQFLKTIKLDNFECTLRHVPHLLFKNWSKARTTYIIAEYFRASTAMSTACTFSDMDRS